MQRDVENSRTIPLGIRDRTEYSTSTVYGTIELQTIFQRTMIS